MSTPSIERPRGPASMARRGMRVLDRAGTPVGTVLFVRDGSPVPAATPRSGWLPELVRRLRRPADPGIDDALVLNLLRGGFVKVDARPLLDRDLYIPVGDVAAVVGDTMVLAATRERFVAMFP